jgi:hypothetical protein
MFDLSAWLVSGIIHGYKTNAVIFSETTDRVAKYLTKGLITEAQAIEIGIACPEPSIEPETEVTEEVEETTGENVVEENTEEVTEENTEEVTESEGEE